MKRRAFLVCELFVLIVNFTVCGALLNGGFLSFTDLRGTLALTVKAYGFIRITVRALFAFQD